MYLKNIINILIEGYVIYQISCKKLSICCYETKSKRKGNNGKLKGRKLKIITRRWHYKNWRYRIHCVSCNKNINNILYLY